MESKNGKNTSKKPANSKSSKNKKAKVIMPKMNNVVKPQSMTLEEWQGALRQQQAEKEGFAISVVDEQH